MANNWNINTDDYDLYGSQGESSALPGSPSIDESGHIQYDEYFFPLSTTPQSMMDQDPNNTGPTNDFWTDYPISIDVNGYIFYNGENTGINVRGPAGTTIVRWEDLTPEQIAQLKGSDGADGANGRNGTNGTDGADGLSAYEEWLVVNGWADDPAHHPITDFYQYIADLANKIIAEGTGNGSLILNYRGIRNTASGAGATASGYGTSASGARSFTAGLNTVAGYSNQFVIGQNNNNNSNNLFEVGNGSDTSHKSNAFTVNKNGNITASGNITDGNGNVLNNKVDKVTGKQLSTNDFTNTYKNFLDNYTIDNQVSSSSSNPVENRAIYNAIEAVRIANGKPTQTSTSENNDFPIFLVADTTSTTLNTTKYSNNITWNPATKNLKTDATTSYNNTIALGQGLQAGADNQTIFGKYNSANANAIFQIGNGANSNNRNNLLTLTSTDLIFDGNITDGSGNVLSNKQNILTFDSAPTQNSTNPVTSGGIYDYLVAHGINPSGGLNIPEIAVLQGQVAALQTAVTALQTAVAAIGNPREITDDTYTSNTYRIGIDRDEFYIKLLGEEEPSDDNEEENNEEQGE